MFADRRNRQGDLVTEETGRSVNDETCRVIWRTEESDTVIQTREDTGGLFGLKEETDQ